MSAGDGVGTAGRRVGRLAAGLLVGPVLCLMAVLVAFPGAALADSGCTPSVTGTTVVVTCATGSDTWTVPSGVSQVTFDVQGAAGGNTTDPFVSTAGGDGGHVTATGLPVNANTTFYIDVGTKGGAPTAGSPGGGAGGSHSACGPGCFADAGGGGGASVVATGPVTTDPSNWVLAEGGGGGSAVDGEHGGAGGGTTGGSSGESAGGTQTCTSHLDGSGGDSGPGGGGGGGGYCGGGANFDDGGGGGSGYAPDSTHDSFLTASETGNGTVTITYTDTGPPTTTIALAPSSPNGSNGWYTSSVGVSITASDPDDQVAQTRCVLDPATVPASFDDLPNQACSLTTVGTDGQHTIYAASVDANGNKEVVQSASFKVDSTAPSLTVSNLTVNATSPSGATVSTYPASATDANSGLASLSCVPSAPHTFPIGDTMVSCTATDNAGNSTMQSFTVHVKGALEQLQDLLTYVQALGKPGKSLADKTHAAINYYQAGDTTDTCSQLGAIVTEAKAQNGKKLTASQTSYLITTANRIRAVIGC
jgi:hypothetical protein